MPETRIKLISWHSYYTVVRVFFQFYPKLNSLLFSNNRILTGQNCKWSCHKFHPFHDDITSILFNTNSNSDLSLPNRTFLVEIPFQIHALWIVNVEPTHDSFSLYKCIDRSQSGFPFVSSTHEHDLRDRGDDVIWNCLIHTLKCHPFKCTQ